MGAISKGTSTAEFVGFRHIASGRCADDIFFKIVQLNLDTHHIVFCTKRFDLGGVHAEAIGLATVLGLFDSIDSHDSSARKGICAIDTSLGI